jgi:hypothetical protein
MSRGWPKSPFQRVAARSRAHAGGYSHRNRSQVVIRLACGRVMPFAMTTLLHILGGRKALQPRHPRADRSCETRAGPDFERKVCLSPQHSTHIIPPHLILPHPTPSHLIFCLYAVRRCPRGHVPPSCLHALRLPNCSTTRLPTHTSLSAYLLACLHAQPFTHRSHQSHSFYPAHTSFWIPSRCAFRLDPTRPDLAQCGTVRYNTIPYDTTSLDPFDPVSSRTTRPALSYPTHPVISHPDPSPSRDGDRLRRNFDHRASGCQYSLTRSVRHGTNAQCRSYGGICGENGESGSEAHTLLRTGSGPSLL